MENRAPANNPNKCSDSVSATVAISNFVSLRETKDSKDKENKDLPCRPLTAYSKIPVPVRSPRCSLSESTLEPNTPNTRTGTSSEPDRSHVVNAQHKDKDTS